MFWKFIELLIRLLYYRRFRSAKKIGQAGSLLGEGKPQEALTLLEKAGGSLHQSLLPLYAFTRGKILDALGRVDEAEKAFQTVVLSDPKNAKADLELAILTGKQFRFKECREWLIRAGEKEDALVKQQSEDILNLLNQIEDGTRKTEFEQRANAMSQYRIEPVNDKLGFPPQLEILDAWIETSPESAREKLDDIALLIGYWEVDQGASWKINLAIEKTVVLMPDGTEFNPFEFVAKRFIPTSS